MFGVIKDAVDLDLGDIGVTIDREVVGDGGEDDDGADEEGGEEAEEGVHCPSSHRERRGGADKGKGRESGWRKERKGRRLEERPTQVCGSKPGTPEKHRPSLLELTFGYFWADPAARQHAQRRFHLILLRHCCPN